MSHFSNICEFVHVPRQIVGVSLGDGCGSEQEKVDGGDECGSEQEGVDTGGLLCVGSIQGGRCTSPNIEAPEEFEFVSPQCSLMSEGVDCLEAIYEGLSQPDVSHLVMSPSSVDSQSCVSQVSGDLGFEKTGVAGKTHSHYVAYEGCLFECGGRIDEDFNVCPRQVQLSGQLNMLREEEEELNDEYGERVNGDNEEGANDDDDDDEESETEFWFERSVNEKDEERFTLKVDESTQNCCDMKENVISPSSERIDDSNSEQNILKADELAENPSQSEESVITPFIENIENHKESEKNEQFTLQAIELPQNGSKSEKRVISPCSGKLQEPRDSDQDLRIICGSFQPFCRMQPESDSVGLWKSEPDNCGEDPDSNVTAGYHLGEEVCAAVKDVRCKSDCSHDHGPQSCTCFDGKVNCSFCNLVQNPVRERHISAASFVSRPLVRFDVDVEKGSIGLCGPDKTAASGVASTSGEVQKLLAEPVFGVVSSPGDANGLLAEPVSVFGLPDLMVEDIRCMSSDLTSADSRQVHVSSTKCEIGLEHDHGPDQKEEIHGDDFIAKDHRREQIHESDSSAKKVRTEPGDEQGTESIESQDLVEESSHNFHHQDLQNEGELYSEIDLDIESFTFPLGCMNSDLNLSEFGLAPDQVDICPGDILLTDKASCQGDGSVDLTCPQRKTYSVVHDTSVKCTGFVNPAFFSDDVPEGSVGEDGINRRFFGACDAETGICYLNSSLPPVTVEECISDSEVSDEDSFECGIGGNFYEEVSHITEVDTVKRSEIGTVRNEMIDDGKEGSFFGRMSGGVADKSAADNASGFRAAYAGTPGDEAEDANHNPGVVRRSTVDLYHINNDVDKSAEDDSGCKGIPADSLDDGEDEKEMTVWKNTVDSSPFKTWNVDNTSSVYTTVNASVGRAQEVANDDKSQAETQPVNVGARNDTLRSPLPFIETFQQQVRQIYSKRGEALPGVISYSLAEGNNSICDSGTEKLAGLQDGFVVTEASVDNTGVDGNSVVRSGKKDPSISSQDTSMGNISDPCLPDTELTNGVSKKHSLAYSTRMSTDSSSREKPGTAAVVWIYGSEYFVYSDGIYTRNTECAVGESNVEDVCLDLSLAMLSEDKKDTQICAAEVTQMNAGLQANTQVMTASGKDSDVGIGAGSTLMGTTENGYGADENKELGPKKLKKYVSLATRDLEVTQGAPLADFSNRIPPLGDDSLACPALDYVRTAELDASERALKSLKTEALVEPAEINNHHENQDPPPVAVPDFSSSTQSDMKRQTRQPGSVARNVSLRLDPGHVLSRGAQPADLSITSTVVVDDERETLVCSNSFCSDGAQATVTSTVNLLVPSLEIDITIQNPGAISGTLELGEVSCGRCGDRLSDRQSQRNQMIPSISGLDARGEGSSGQVTFGVSNQVSYSDMLACALNFVDVLFWICLAVAIIVFDFRNWTT